MTLKLENISCRFAILELLVIMIYFNPIADLFPSMIQIMLFFAWVFFSVHDTKLWGKAIPLVSISVFIFFVTLLRCIAANQLNMDYYSTFQVVIARYQFMVCPILFVYVSELENEKKKHLFKVAMMSIFGTIMFSLYYILWVDPQAVRNTQRDVHLWGVGDFMLMYAIAVIIGPLLLVIMQRIKNKQKSLALILLISAMVICLVLCNLVTSVVIAALSIFVTYCVTRRQKIIYVVLAIILSIMIALRSVFANLLYYIAAKNIFYWSTNNKIIAIANVLVGNMNNIDTLSRRFMLANWSLQSFKEHPFLGINWKNHIYGKIGCHCQWADDLGRFGVIGNFVIIYNYIKIARYTVNYANSRLIKDSIISVWIMFAILGFLNPCLSGTLLMMMFVIVPTFDSLIGEENE